MIEYGTDQDIKDILELCTITHPMKEKEFLTYYFRNLYNDGKCVLIREDEKIISCMQMQEHTLHFHNKALLCSYLFGVSTHVDYRLRGFMDKIMHHVLDICNQNYLITFIEAYNPKLYKKYGFETISYRKKFTISSTDIKMINVQGVSDKVDIAGFVKLYKEFSKRFDCYYIRDEKYYQNYLAAIKNNAGHIASYCDEENNVQGYCVYYVKDDIVEVKEIIYLDSVTMYKLLTYAMQNMPYVSLEVSNNERIEKLFKRAIPRTSSCVMARINNYSLFNKLYSEKVKGVNEAFHILRKPILINEKY